MEKIDIESLPDFVVQTISFNRKLAPGKVHLLGRSNNNIPLWFLVEIRFGTLFKLLDNFGSTGIILQETIKKQRKESEFIFRVEDKLGKLFQLSGLTLFGRMGEFWKQYRMVEMKLIRIERKN